MFITELKVIEDTCLQVYGRTFCCACFQLFWCSYIAIASVCFNVYKELLISFSVMSYTLNYMHCSVFSRQSLFELATFGQDEWVKS